MLPQILEQDLLLQQQLPVEQKLPILLILQVMLQLVARQALQVHNQHDHMLHLLPRNQVLELMQQQIKDIQNLRVILPQDLALHVQPRHDQVLARAQLQQLLLDEARLITLHRALVHLVPEAIRLLDQVVQTGHIRQVEVQVLHVARTLLQEVPLLVNLQPHHRGADLLQVARRIRLLEVLLQVATPLHEAHLRARDRVVRLGLGAAVAVDQGASLLAC